MTEDTAWDQRVRYPRNAKRGHFLQCVSVAQRERLARVLVLINRCGAPAYARGAGKTVGGQAGASASRRGNG